MSLKNKELLTTINANDGSLIFWGFIDSSDSYGSITFGNTAAGTDVFGFDDMVIGDERQVVPEIPGPASLLLLGSGLASLGLIRRRRSS